MNKVRVLCKDDGGISILHPAIKSKKLNETEEVWYQRVMAKSTPVGIEYYDIDKSELPTSREHRYGWEWKNNKIFVNQTRSEEKKNAIKNEAKLKLLNNLGLTEQMLEKVKKL